MTQTDKIKQVSAEILTLCESPNTALQAIHKIIGAGGAGELSWQVVYQRVMADQDVQGAYYLATFAQKIDDLPFDARPLIDMVMAHGDDALKNALLDKLPKQAKEQLSKSDAK
ncbi:hypothetical protein B0181_10985 [Moraxella caviae]|uniref:DUF2336 domain-containing protein n=1 Tax=Moraxella caviae TaxID=34060 RepID=A0A1S9ZUR7_9GAMM|nr:hypothetical protein [Moraxella caviae]OOR87147.1 hypothetical protein B0181_10985 [Moraxella caviae]STZ14781.1 Uncharacterised protein [Moraxella caviae]